MIKWAEFRTSVASRLASLFISFYLRPATSSLELYLSSHTLLLSWEWMFAIALVGYMHVYFSDETWTECCLIFTYKKLHLHILYLIHWAQVKYIFFTLTWLSICLTGLQWNVFHSLPKMLQLQTKCCAMCPQLMEQQQLSLHFSARILTKKLTFASCRIIEFERSASSNEIYTQLAFIRHNPP